MNIVTIMNYPDRYNENKMCCLFIDSILKHNPNCNLIIMHEKERKLSADIKKFINKKYRDSSIRIIPCTTKTNAFIPTHNINFKLYNLSRIDDQFIFIDADTVCLEKLDILWECRLDKPFIGCDHQIIPKHTQQYKNTFLNSGVQVVGDTSWYDWNDISKIHYTIRGRYSIPGFDQAVLYEYCKHIGYDYTHPKITPAWNSCAGYTKITKVNDKWCGEFIDSSGNKDLNYEVFINHYWDVFKPWNINCPIYNSFEYDE